MKLIVLILLTGLSLNIFALDSSVVPIATVNPSSSAGQCSYYFIDIVNGTMPGGTLPSGTNLTLQFYNNGMPTSFSTAVPCDGTYKIVFNLNVLANSNVNQITITPQIADSTGTPIYPTGGSPANLYIYPQCNNVNYTATPYCSMGEISGSSQVSLTNGTQIGSLRITASSSITITGGIISAYLVSSP